MALEGAKPRPRRAVGGKPVNQASRKTRKKKGDPKGTGIVSARASATTKREQMPSKRSIRSGAGAKGAGFDRGSKLRSGMRTPKGWRDQLRDYHGVTF